MEVLLFGITKEIIGKSRITIEQEGGPKTVGELKDQLKGRYTALNSLRSLAVAVDNEYADDATLLKGAREIALIPPVSGG